MNSKNSQLSLVLAAVIGVLFFLSGFAGLVYQVLWMRELGLLFGTTVHAAATTTVSFFIGLGVGSAFFGERLNLSKSPLRTYGLLELAVGVSAILFFGLLGAYHAIYPGVVAALGDNSEVLLVVKFLLAVVVLFPPAFCMGGTLPVISRFLTAGYDPAVLGKRVPIFYGINTMGAATGALSAGFFLPRWIGMTGSYWLATGVMAAVGIVAIGLSRFHSSKSAEASGGNQNEGDLAKLNIPREITGLAFFSGFSTLALQVLWIRMFAQTLHNSVYTYSTILVTFLVALAVGAWIASWLARSFGNRASQVLVWLLLIAGVLTLASPSLFHYLGSDQGGYLGDSENWPEYLRLVFTAAGMTIFPAAVALGIIFPFLLKLSEKQANGDGGRVVGRLAAMNTAGAVLGSLVAGFFLLDLFGLWASIRLLGVCYLVLVFALSFLTFTQKEINENRSWSSRVAAALFLMLFLTWFDPVRLPVVYHLPIERKETLLKVDEGSDATVAVIRRDDEMRIKVNNFYVLGSSGSTDNERLQGHLPLLVHQDPQNVFLLGLGTGITAGGALQVDGVGEITVAELLPGVIEAAREFFRPWLNGLFENERVRVLAEDGRNFLAVTREKYDVIIADLFIPWRTGVGGLYTREHYERSFERLEPGGIYAQWLPLYQLTENEFASIANTMRQVFPRVTVWRGDFFAESPIVCLIGHRDTDPLDWSSFDERSVSHNRKLGINQKAPFKHVAGHLTFYAGDLTGTNLYSDARLNTDDFPHIEFEAPMKHRAEKAGEITWFNGSPLIEFFDRLQEELPFEEDPWLEELPAFSRTIAQAGHLLHELSVAKAEEDREGAETASRELARITGRLTGIYGSD
ncbi:MAG: fused MFS/spermidine synthase [Verrucomicrobiota bacterium]